MKVRTRFEGLDLIDRVPEELWTEVHYMYGRQWSTPSTRKRNAKKTKWLSEEALQIAEKRTAVKGKEENERYTHLNAELPRTGKRGKKGFPS